MAEPDDMILPKLREMVRQDAPLEERTSLIVAERARRFSSENARRSLADLARADALIAKLLGRDFEARISALEKTVRELEDHK